MGCYNAPTLYYILVFTENTTVWIGSYLHKKYIGRRMPIFNRAKWQHKFCFWNSLTHLSSKLVWNCFLICRSFALCVKYNLQQMIVFRCPTTRSNYWLVFIISPDFDQEKKAFMIILCSEEMLDIPIQPLVSKALSIYWGRLS